MMFGLSSEVINEIGVIISHYKGVKEAVLFGSRALGRHSENSDIDIALIGEFDLLTFSKIKSELNELPAPYKFDVIDYNNLDNPDLKDHIDRVGKTLYKNS